MGEKGRATFTLVLREKREAVRRVRDIDGIMELASLGALNSYPDLISYISSILYRSSVQNQQQMQKMNQCKKKLERNVKDSSHKLKRKTPN
jgi:hypothetical protein